MQHEELLNAIIQIVNKNERFTSDRLRLLNGRLRDKYTPEEILGAAEAFSASQWHKDNGQMSVDNLLRPSKFGRWFTKYMEEKNINTFDQDAAVLARMGGGNESQQ